MPDRVAHRLRQIGGARDAIDMREQPFVQRVDNRPTSLIPNLLTVFGGMAADLRLDRIQLADPLEHLGG
jgi:hypothetical protein